MSQNTNGYQPTTSAPQSESVSVCIHEVYPLQNASVKQETNAQWKIYYRNIKPNEDRVAQYQSQPSYFSSANPPLFQVTTGLDVQTSNTLSFFDYSVQPTIGFASSTEDVPPPGNEEILIPGLSLDAEKDQPSLNTTDLSEKKKPLNNVKFWPVVSAVDVVDLERLRPQDFIAQQQYEAVLSQKRNPNPVSTDATVPTISARLNFPMIPNQQMMGQSAPFLIRPAIPDKTRIATTPAYISVATPANQLNPVKLKQDLGRTLEAIQSSEPLKLATSMDPPIQRKRRKFEEQPPAPKFDVETLKEEIKKQERGYRFRRPTSQIPLSLCEEPRHKSKLIGQCQKLEKSYFRLSGRPDPSVVRPEPILKRALDRLVDLLKHKQVDYFYAADQFKGMRQDCTVQQLQSETCVRIYEASARAHLEYGEIWEYNQCQSNLEALYSQGIPGCRSEFVSYRIIYQVLHVNKGEAILMNKTLRSLSPQDLESTEVQHALDLAKALLVNDLRQIFYLYVRAPNLSRALVDHVLDEIRYKATRMFIKSIRLKESIDSMIEDLGFFSESLPTETTTKILPGCTEAIYLGKADIQEAREEACHCCIEWLKAHGAVLIEGTSGNTKDTLIDPDASRKSLFKAKAVNAVAHGDPNLDMSYFLVKIDP